MFSIASIYLVLRRLARRLAEVVQKFFASRFARMVSHWYHIVTDSIFKKFALRFARFGIIDIGISSVSVCHRYRHLIGIDISSVSVSHRYLIGIGIS